MKSNKNLKVGDIVCVYEMPYRETMLEGKAKLIKNLYGNMWEVQFIDKYDETIVKRIVVDMAIKDEFNYDKDI